LCLPWANTTRPDDARHEKENCTFSETPLRQCCWRAALCFPNSAVLPFETGRSSVPAIPRSQSQQAGIESWKSLERHYRDRDFGWRHSEEMIRYLTLSLEEVYERVSIEQKYGMPPRKKGARPSSGDQDSSPLPWYPWGEGGKPVRLSAANGPERSEGAQGKLREPGEGLSIHWPPTRLRLIANVHPRVVPIDCESRQLGAHLPGPLTRPPQVTDGELGLGRWNSLRMFS
jgi:hypothetical protein